MVRRREEKRREARRREIQRKRMKTRKEITLLLHIQSVIIVSL